MLSVPERGLNVPALQLKHISWFVAGLYSPAPHTAQMAHAGSWQSPPGEQPAPLKECLSSTAPAALPDGWTEYQDEASGSSYYCHNETGRTQWDMPEPALTGASEHQSSERMKASSRMSASSF